MAYLDVDEAAFFREWFVAARVRVSKPRAGWVSSELIREHALEHEYLFAADVHVLMERCAWRPSNEGDILAAILMERADR